jgi:hypothetical protein
MSQIRQVMKELDTVGGFLARAEADLAAGAVLDIAPLEGQIEKLCTHIGDLPPGEDRSLQSRLLALIDTFGHLGRTIEAALDELKTEMGGVSGRRQAASAYAKSSEPRK